MQGMLSLFLNKIFLFVSSCKRFYLWASSKSVFSKDQKSLFRIIMYLIRQPSANLWQFIDFFWQSSFSELKVSLYEELYVTQLEPNIVFNLKNSYTRNDVQISDSEIETVNTKPVIFKHDSENLIFGIRFKVGAMALFTQVSLHETVDNHVDIVSIFGNRVNELMEKLMECESFEQRIILTERFLCSVIDEKRLFELLKCQNLLQIFSQHETLSKQLSQIIPTMPVTQRTLERYFLKQVGVSPKKAFRIIRFKKVFHAFHQSKFCLKEFDYYEYGYYDLAHFSNDFKSFTSFSPTAYVGTPYFDDNLQSGH